MEVVVAGRIVEIHSELFFLNRKLISCPLLLRNQLPGRRILPRLLLSFCWKYSPVILNGRRSGVAQLVSPSCWSRRINWAVSYPFRPISNPERWGNQSLDQDLRRRFCPLRCIFLGFYLAKDKVESTRSTPTEDIVNPLKRVQLRADKGLVQTLEHFFRLHPNLSRSRSSFCNVELGGWISHWVTNRLVLWVHRSI